MGTHESLVTPSAGGAGEGEGAAMEAGRLVGPPEGGAGDRDPQWSLAAAMRAGRLETPEGGAGDGGDAETGGVAKITKEGDAVITKCALPLTLPEEFSPDGYAKLPADAPVPEGPSKRARLQFIATKVDLYTRAIVNLAKHRANRERDLAEHEANYVIEPAEPAIFQYVARTNREISALGAEIEEKKDELKKSLENM